MNKIKEQISAIIGENNLITDPEGLKPYSIDNISFIPDRSPVMAAKVSNTEQIKSILAVARRHKMPVTPFSSNQNGHGASIPAVPGITIDLRNLKTIHLIDELSRNAIIDVGVTFEELQKKALAKGLRVLTPIELPADSSIISSCIEMSPLYAWPKYGKESILTMEILLPNGELLKTGSSGLPIFNEKPYMPFLGPPALLNKVWYGSQGTLGIVTKAVIKLKTNYDSREVMFIPFNRFAESTKAVREIKRLNSAVEFFLANATYLAGLLSDNDEIFESLKKELPPVTAVIVLRGEKRRVGYQKEDLFDLARELNIKVLDSLEADREAGRKILEEIDFPKGHKRFKQFKGAYHVIPFICIARQLPVFEQVLPQLSGAFGYDATRIGQFLLPVEPASFHFQYSFYDDPNRPEEHMLVKQLFDTLSETLIKMGAFFSRPYGNWATLVYNKANAYKELIKEFKEVIDPENIMNPGRLI